MDDFEELRERQGGQRPLQTSLRRGHQFPRGHRMEGGVCLRVPANVAWLESLGDGSEQLLAGGNVALALRLNLLGRRGFDHADDLHVGLLLRAATCSPC